MKFEGERLSNYACGFEALIYILCLGVIRIHACWYFEMIWLFLVHLMQFPFPSFILFWVSPSCCWGAVAIAKRFVCSSLKTVWFDDVILTPDAKWTSGGFFSVHSFLHQRRSSFSNKHNKRQGEWLKCLKMLRLFRVSVYIFFIVSWIFFSCFP